MNKKSQSFSSLLFLLNCLQFSMSAQVAGEVPPGGSVEWPDVNLRLYEDYSDTIAYVDLDGNGGMDIKITLFKGYPPSDASNLVLMETPGNKISFCVDSSNSLQVVHYDLHDSLCTGTYNWSADSIYVSGCYGGWSCTHDTSSVTDKFMAYRNNMTGDIGWIRFSMKLYSQIEATYVSFSISEMLVFNLNTSTTHDHDEFYLDICPNPSTNGTFRISCSQPISRVDIADLSGNKIATYKEAADDYPLPETAGVYLISVCDTKGKVVTKKLMRL